MGYLFEGFLFSIGCLFEEFLVIADHHATGENELSVKAGDIVRVIKKDEETGAYSQEPCGGHKLLVQPREKLGSDMHIIRQCIWYCMYHVMCSHLWCHYITF